MQVKVLYFSVESNRNLVEREFNGKSFGSVSEVKNLAEMLELDLYRIEDADAFAVNWNDEFYALESWIAVVKICKVTTKTKSHKFKWIARCSDGAFEDESEKFFTSKEECYNDMRNHALEKMKWNTEFYDFDDMTDGEFIGYDVKFMKDKIIHRSYSGLYVYEILKD